MKNLMITFCLLVIMNLAGCTERVMPYRNPATTNGFKPTKYLTVHKYLQQVEADIHKAVNDNSWD